MNKHLYEYVARFENICGDIQESGGQMIAGNASEVLDMLLFDCGDKKFECKIQRSQMSVVPVQDHGNIYSTLWNRTLSEREVQNGICGNDVCHENLKDVIFISDHPVRERIKR